MQQNSNNTTLELKFRPLLKEEVELRLTGRPIPKTCAGSANEWYLASLLIYKDARVDQTLLDETVGKMNWKREHRFENGQCICTVSIWDESKQEWIAKSDVGVPSDFESVKGQFSDSFKRACFSWGVGRELYTAPDINVWLYPNETDGRKVFTKFFVDEIRHDESGTHITGLRIVDEHHNLRFEWPFRKQKKASDTVTSSLDNLHPTEAVQPLLRPEGAQQTAHNPWCPPPHQQPSTDMPAPGKDNSSILTPDHPQWKDVVNYLKNPANDARRCLANYVMTGNNKELLCRESGRLML